MEVIKIRDDIRKKYVTKLTKNDLIKFKILVLLEKTQDKLSITAISKELGIKYETVHKAITFLKLCGLLEVSTEKHGDLVYEYVHLSVLGKKVAGDVDHGIFN